MNPCFVIPNYNHGATIVKLLEELAPYNVPCIIVDDGSDHDTKQQLKKAAKQFVWVTVLTLPYNQGKGAAVLAGFQYAKDKNYTHVIQIDADGQHDLSDLPKFLAAIEKTPKALISGQSIYDQSAPKSRFYGRKITNFWCCIETLSFNIKEAMCGYRVYPLQQTIQVINKCTIDKRMGFDVEIIVRLYWADVKMVFIPTKVTYPVDGISHFKPFKSNLEISWLHTRLFFGMLKRLPKLLAHIRLTRKKTTTPVIPEASASELSGIQKWKSKPVNYPEILDPTVKPRDDKVFVSNKHWSNMKEKGNFIFLKIMLYSYKLLGRKFTYLLLYPIIVYFYCASRTARKASKQYLMRLKKHIKKIGYKTNDFPSSSFKHFLSFGETLLDKLSVWTGDIGMDQIDFPNKSLFLNQIASGKGGIVFTAHLGNIEIARALSGLELSLKINALTFTQNAAKFNAILERINPKFRLNLIEVKNLDIALAIKLKEKIDAGEFIVVMGDRTSLTQPHRCITAKFLEHKAYFPQGSFILAGLLQCPVYFMLCLKQDRENFKIVFEEFAHSINIKKAVRYENLKHYSQKYASLLEKQCEQYPLQWFNFFNFWQSNLLGRSQGSPLQKIYAFLKSSGMCNRKS